MSEIKSVICLKNGKSYPKAIDNSSLIGKKIGDKIDGALVGFKGLELQITGGSDLSGFPMRADVLTSSRKRVFTSTKSVGVNIEARGCKVRKTVHGGIIADDIMQVNFKVLKGDSDQYFKEAPKEEVKAAPAS